ncbi:MAG: hypothetical protein E7678_06600 [Ruminococcaceae bacterium]|nr:hypothetical protein [Oscillospiraceae bacterium]
MQNKTKKLISLIVTVALLLCFSTNTFSLGISAVTPRWVSISSMELNIVFDGNYAVATGLASKQSTATSIEGTVTLYKLVDDEWVYMDEWYNYRTRGTLAVSGEFSCESGVTYKAEFVVTVYTGTFAETETTEISKRCP